MENDLLFEEWKMTKEQIRHFDDMIIRLRVEGIPIALVIIGLGFTIAQYLPNVKIPLIQSSAASAMFIFASLYLIPIFVFDMVHFKLLMISVRHAIDIEMKYFTEKLTLTQQLTNPFLTWIHTIAFIIIYSLVIAIGFILGVLFWNVSVPAG